MLQQSIKAKTKTKIKKKLESSNIIITKKNIVPLFPLIILISIIKAIIAGGSLTTAKSMILSNGNFFSIETTGIFVYDSFEKTTQLSSLLFTGSQIMTSIDQAYKTILKEENGYLFSLINNYFYIFDSSGNYLFSEDMTSILSSTHYTLVPYKKENNYYYYVIGFVSSEKQTVSLYYYKLNLDFTLSPIENTQVSSINYYPKNSQNNIQSLHSQALSCEKMISQTEGKVLTCFYE